MSTIFSTIRAMIPVSDWVVVYAKEESPFYSVYHLPCIVAGREKIFSPKTRTWKESEDDTLIFMDVDADGVFDDPTATINFLAIAHERDIDDERKAYWFSTRSRISRAGAEEKRDKGGTMTSLIEEYGETAADVYFQPVQEDFILPVQLLSPPPPTWTRFMLTLLVEEAIADAIRPIPAKRGNYRNNAIRFRDDAVAWIESDERSLTYPTFRDTCDYLGLEPHAIRKAMAKPGFRLATEWTIHQDHGNGQHRCGDAHLLEKIDRKAQRRKRRA